MMKRFRHTIEAGVALCSLLLCVACAEEQAWEVPMTKEQQALLGRAVNFDASYSDLFTTRTGYTDGRFNVGDRMVIYRQNYEAGLHGFDEKSEAFRTYQFVSKMVSGTSIELGTSWLVAEGCLGSNGRGGDNKPETFMQKSQDSLTWESGATVRFRAWALNNLNGCITTKDWNSYYPDFSVAGWVTASGPTNQIPLNLKHVGCRLRISPKSGNQIAKVEICTTKEDYAYEDNAGSKEEDNSDKSADAEEKALAVEAVYNTLCWPGGLDFDSGLKALSKAFKGSNTPSMVGENAGQMIAFNTLTPDEIIDKAVRPQFNGNDGHYYLIAIPYDMSNGANAGQPITLPAHTRFRVYIRDVNNGDKSTSGYEGAYHLFCLSDIKDSEGNSPFKDGLTLRGGCSYTFTVGYHYNQLTVTTDHNLSWTDGSASSEDAEEKSEHTPSSPQPYKWWKDGLNTAIEAALNPNISERKDYAPEFELNTVQEVCEFIRLVNGKAATKTDGLALQRRHVLDTESGTYFQWYRTPVTTSDTAWVTRENAEKEGYIIYKQFFPSNGDVPAYSMEQLLKAPYPFYDALVQRRLKVKIAEDIDFKDLRIPGMTEPFRGYLDGGMHTLKNLFVEGGVLVTKAQQAVLTNLAVESWHPFCLVGQGEEAYLAGISIQAPQSGQIAQRLEGNCYVVGCITQGNGGKALVGEADNLFMMGCMQTCSDLTGGALLGAYSAGATEFFKPQEGKVAWGKLMACYYDIDRSPQATAVGGHAAYSYLPQQYVRGTETKYLCAIKDYLLQDKAYYELLSVMERRLYYGIAPWKAMNSAIYYYNQLAVGKLYPCEAQFTVNSTGYNNRYPQLVAGRPTDYVDLPAQNN
ncbi:MAG: hypothetical protein SOW01_07410 [Mediterranea sp.]|nr:hypothetical protein [Mediterranea sp.]